jgi:thiol:disulfide interchange protein DsbD
MTQPTRPPRPLTPTPATLHGLFLALVALLLLAPVARAATSDLVTIKATPSSTTVAPGGTLVVALEVDYADGWHSWPNKPVIPPGLDDFTPIETKVRPSKADAGGKTLFTIDAELIQWPKPKPITSSAFGDKPLEILSYGGSITVYVPVLVAKDAPVGAATLRFAYAYQACDDSVCAPPDAAEIEVPLSISADATPASTPPLPPGPPFDGFDTTAFARLAGSPVAPSPAAASSPASPPASAEAQPPSTVRDFGAFGLKLNIDTATDVGVLLVLLVAVLGGIVLNFTPCVLPIIPIKMLGLEAAAKSPGRYFLLGTATSAGVVAFWLAIGAAIAFTASFKATSQLSGYWTFNGAIGLFILTMALGMFGSYSVGLPNWIYNITPRHDTVPGCFFWGVLTAVLSTPCTAPFMGSAAAWATTQKPLLVLSVFAAIGVGMALPYFILSFSTRLIGFLPKAGPASEVLKQVLGLLMLGVSVFFIGNALAIVAADYPWMPKVFHWWGVAAACIAAAAWLALRTWQLTPAAGKRATFTVFALLLATAAVWWTRGETVHAKRQWTEREAARAASAGGASLPDGRTLWAEYTPEVFTRLREAGKPVLLDFTADWCVTCKALRRSVLDRQEVREAILASGVVSLEVDCTSTEAPAWDHLKKLGQVGVPYVVLYIPGQDQPVWGSNGFTPSEILAALHKARTVAAR